MHPHTPQPGTRILRADAAAQVLIGVADGKISRDPGAQLVTMALGSCLGITFYEPVRKIGGMLHVMLPDSTQHHRPITRRAMFVDTGVKLMLEKLAQLGCDPRFLHCKVFGGAQVFDAENFLRIGAKNIEAFSQLSRELKLNVGVWEVSGRVNRSIRLFNETGEVLVKVPGQPEFLR